MRRAIIDDRFARFKKLSEKEISKKKTLRKAGFSR